MFKKISTALLVSGALFTAATPAQASGRSLEQIYTQCGIGGMVFGSYSKGLAAISNVTTYLGLFAALSDSSTPQFCTPIRLRTAVMIKETFPSLEKDVVTGHGQYLQALNNMTSCPAATSALRQRYAAYTLSNNYSQANRSANAEEMYQLLQQGATEAGCSNI